MRNDVACPFSVSLLANLIVTFCPMKGFRLNEDLAYFAAAFLFEKVASVLSTLPLADTTWTVIVSDAFDAGPLEMTRSSNDSVAVPQDGWIVTVWDRVSLRGAVRPPSRASHFPAKAGVALALAIRTPDVADHGEVPESKPPLPISCLPQTGGALLVMIQLKEAWPELCTLDATVSVALTVTENVPVTGGVPVTLPFLELIDKPGGRPVADQLVIGALALEVADKCLVTVVARPLVCVPGGLTVTVSVSSLAPVASWAGTL